MGARILVVDDEPQIRKFLRISLSANGYEVIEAENGKAGIQTSHDNKPDLLILDLGLPDMNGQDVISIVRETSTNTDYRLVRTRRGNRKGRGVGSRRQRLRGQTVRYCRTNGPCTSDLTL